MLFNLSEHNSIANHFVAELRDRQVQKDRLRFRKNAHRLGQIMAYEISRHMRYRNTPIETPLGTSVVNLMPEPPVIVAIMRAGLPYFQGFLDFFDQSDAGFIGAYRQEGHTEIVINLEYLATPSLAQREVILVDPMLATGKSIVQSVNALAKNGKPSHLYVASLVSVPEGIQYVNENVDIPHSLWTCAVDDNLNDRFYIVPGLGDAGDLSFGEKL
ncbi:uracil phosphoribosyltransferase [Chryseolinea serpens]|jgi:uracil phosphoribosyltransferase|uniref:Uracil phosphoribosyltransferase n=1 Tax=Chryseolinea serpens TaxID=947013 RepID=A0A1M5WHF0_9BACT|nr:uracil phosphoribosyltransferase [Chryseolinea serpens]SHH86961.1 uracil phosphoribosyltransferase [Chryseolinea serpens]